MDIQICQCCGIIIRGKSKFCTGCGTTISKFSPVTLPVISHTAAPLAVTLDPDPLILERTMVKVRYGNMPAASPQTVPGGSDDNGHGPGNGNGDAPHESDNGHYDEADHLASAAQAAAASTSKLQNILGSAARGLGAGSSPGGGMISYDEDEAGNSAAIEPAEAKYEDDPQPLAPDPLQFQPAASAAQAAAALATAPPQGIPPQHSQTFNRIVTNAGAFDALAGSTVAAATVPVTVTRAISPGLDAGAVLATNLSAAPSMVPITSAEAPAGSPSASAMHATTVVAPATGSPENIPMGERPEPLPAPPESSRFAEPTATQAEPSATAAAVATAEVATAEAPPTVQSPKTFESSESSPAPSAVPDFFGGPPTADAAPSMVTPAAIQTEPPPSEAPPMVVAPPMVADLPADSPAPPLTVQGPETPVLQSSEDVSPPSKASFAGTVSSFDFFAAPEASLPSTAAEFTAPKLGGLVTPSDRSNVVDTSKFSNGVPSVVQDAIRAAASASQTGLPPVGVMEDDRDAPKTRLITADDEDLSRDAKPKSKKRKVSDDDSDVKPKSKGKSKAAPGSTKRAARDDDDDDDEKPAPQQSKTLRVGPIEVKRKTAIIAAVVLLVGFQFSMFLFGAISKAMSGAAGGAAGGVAVIGGDWSMGVLLPNGNNLKATINLQQAGSTLSGNGVDSYGYFTLTNGNVGVTQDGKQKVQFAKVYVDDQHRPKGKAITYLGVVDWVNPNPGDGKIPFFAHMYGKWVLEKRQGYGWRAQIVKETGDWEAGQIRVDKTSTGVAMAPGTGGAAWDPGQSLKDVMGFPTDGSPAKMATFFARIAGILLLLGLGLVFASMKFFGPAGMLNIWLKKEYIPSQFKSQHNKMVREFGKPIKTGGLPLGWRADWHPSKFWLPQKLALPAEVRAQNPHVMVLGAGSKGKSRLIASMIHQDIESNDRAVVVIDSDGGLIDLLMAKIASSPNGNEICKRLIIVDPTHGGEVFAYNPLEYPEDGDLQNAASAVVFGFKAIYTEPPGSQSQWNQQTANILRNSAILLMANGKTLTDLPVLLSENDFRDVLLEKVERLKNEKAEYTTLLEAWGQYKRLARTDQWINWVEPILNRVQPMLGDPRIRPILTKAKGDLNLKEIISEGKILFVKVPQGQLDQNANLLGSLIVTGIKQAAMSLSLKGGSRKHQCALYLDEFDNFIEKETFDAITSETKKFQIGFLGSSKTLQGLPEDFRNQILINVGTMCCFALAKKDGDILGPSMFRVDGRKIKHQTLQNIFNKVNTAPQFELISDEEKLNIDRVVGQEERHYFCYRVGTVAGVFNMRAPDFNDVPDKDVNWTLIDQVYARSVPKD